MGPHETLGVPPDCTRAQAKEAFRAQARAAHPDRGGDIPTFIRLRRAYEEIMADFDRKPLAALDREPRPSDAGRAARPPDPLWDPDLILLDDPPRRAGPPPPPDPNWEPELILTDRDAKDRGPASTDRGSTRHGGLDWYLRLAQASDRQGHRPPSPWIDVFGLAALFFLLLLLGALVYWAATADLTGSERSLAPTGHSLGLGTMNAPPTITRPAKKMTAPALIATSGPKKSPMRLERLAIATAISSRFDCGKSAVAVRGRRRTAP
jgi:hypothetical protein